MEVDQQGVRVTSIEPGLVRTEFAGSSHGSANDYYAPLFEPLGAEDVAGPCSTLSRAPNT